MTPGGWTYPRGSADLVYRDGQWFLFVTVDVPDASPIDPTDFVGVDLGIANIATDSDGNAHTGADVERIRKKHNLQRKRLGRRNTKGAKKKIRRMRDKEARFRRHQNHVISKAIVETAKRTDRGIALEDLEGIRERVTARGGDARNRLGGWALRATGRLHRLQGSTGGRRGRVRRPGVHQPDLSRVRPLRALQSPEPRTSSIARRATTRPTPM